MGKTGATLAAAETAIGARRNPIAFIVNEELNSGVLTTPGFIWVNERFGYLFENS